MKRYIIPLLAGAVILSTSLSAQAQLIAYDGFNYPDGSQLWGATPGQGDGGIGWLTTWSATSAALATNSATGLSYGSLSVTPLGSVVMGNPVGYPAGNASASSQRILPNTLGNLAAAAGSQSIWMSFLYQNWVTDMAGLPGFREAKLALFSGATTNANGTANVNGSERLDVGSPNTYSAGASDTLTLWQGSTYSSSGTATPRGSGTSPVFILLRIDVDNTTAADTAYAWFNPVIGGAEPSTASAVSFNLNDLSAVNAIRLQAGNTNANAANAVFAADEIRVGYTFGDVAPIPEPTIFALTGVGAFLLVSGLRRNSKK